MPGAALAQQPITPQAEPPEIDKIEFEGNETIGADALRNVMILKETPSGFSKFLYRTFGEKIGSKPEYFDNITLDADQNRIVEYYQRQGFYQTLVSNKFTVDTGSQRVNITFTIQENKRSFVDSVRYLGLGGITPDVSEKIFKEPILQRGMPYESDKASAEINRVLSILVNNGYPSADLDREHSAAQRYASTNNFLLTYVFVPGTLRHFGDITVRATPPREDITDNLAVRELDFQPGDLYGRDKMVTSESNLNRLGLFETATVDTLRRQDSTASVAIPILVSVRPRPRNELSPEFIASDENNALNLGVGIGYTNHNFFGDARTFSARIRARTQSIRELFQGRGFRDTTVIGAVNIEFQVLQPYLSFGEKIGRLLALGGQG